MRRRIVIAVVVCAALGVALATRLTAGDGDATGATTTPGALALVGDSLNVGVERYLPGVLEGWRIDTDDVVGRSTAQGVDALERLGAALPEIVVVSLGTNDPQGDEDGFRTRVRAALARIGPGRCVVWATVWRDGPSPLNDVLEHEASDRTTLRLLRWHELVAEHPEWLTADGVHPTEEGYRARAEAIGRAVRECPR